MKTRLHLLFGLLLLSWGMAQGQNLVRNGTFAVYPAAGGAPIAPNTAITRAPNDWQSSVPYAGTAVYAADTRVAIQTGSVNYAAGVVVQTPFPGDLLNNVPPSATWLYANGNDTGAPYTIWRQTVAVQPNTTYVFSCYTSNAITTAGAAEVDPLLRFRVNGADVGAAIRIYDDSDPLSGHGGRDLWDRRTVSFTTGADVTSAVLELRSEAIGSGGDDLAVTAISCSASGPLTAFEAAARGTDAELTWTTVGEGRNERFEVERSRDGQLFERIGAVDGRGSSSQPQHYIYRDANAAAVGLELYYRLRLLSANGTAGYSVARLVQFEAPPRPPITLHPNPARSRAKAILNLESLAPGLHPVVIYDLAGRRLCTLQLAGGQPHALHVADLPLGTYVVHVAGQVRRLVRDE